MNKLFFTRAGRIITALFFTVLLVSNPAVYSQNNQFRFERFNSESGLSDNSASVLFQDSKGFLWIGSQNGLNRYDAYSFRIYRHNPLDTSTISGGIITSVSEDRDGDLWISTLNGGLSRYLRAEDKFRAYHYDRFNEASLPSNTVLSTLVDSEGRVWAGTSSGLALFDFYLESFTRFNDPVLHKSIYGKIINAIFQDTRGNIWAGTASGLFLITENNGIFNIQSAGGITTFNKLLSSVSVEAITESPGGILWIGTTGDGLIKYDPAKNTILQFSASPYSSGSLSDNSVLSLAVTKRGVLWVGTKNGLNRLELDKEILNSGDARFTRIVSDPEDQHSLAGAIIFSLLEDKSGLLWAGTNAGLNKYNRAGRQFQTFKQIPGNRNSLNDNVIKAVTESPDGTIWIGTQNGGLNRFSFAKNEFSAFVNNPNSVYSISGNNVTAVVDGGGENLWVGTTTGLNRFDKKTGRFNRFIYSEGKNSLNNNYVSAISDYGNFLLIGTWGGGLNVLEKTSGSFAHFMHDPENSQSISSDQIKTILTDSELNIWIGTWGGGLSYLNHKQTENGITEPEFFNFDNETLGPVSLKGLNITAVFEDGKRNIWIGTYGAGLKKLEYTADSDGMISAYQITSFTKENGLADDNISAILEDGNGNLWISTGGGISKFNGSTLSFQNFDKSDGLQGNQFESGSLKSANGFFIFGGTGGFNLFYPEKIRIGEYESPIVITNVEVSGAQVPFEKALYSGTPIKVTYKNNSFMVEFASLDYSAPDKNKYAYKLEGFDDEWNYGGSRRMAVYTNINPGKYVFKVKGTNSSGIWNEKGTSLIIEVETPIWLSVYASVLYGVLFAGIIFLLVKLGNWSANKKIGYLKNDLVAMTAENNAARIELNSSLGLISKLTNDLEKDLGIIFSGIKTVQNGITETRDKIKLKETFLAINAEGQKTLRNINRLKLLMLIRGGAYQLSPRKFNLKDLLERVKDQYIAVANKNKLEFIVRYETDKVNAYGDENSFFIIFDNLIDNALKFTFTGKITVAVSENKEGELRVSVADTGLGIEGETLKKLFPEGKTDDGEIISGSESAGIGLKLVKNLLILNEGRIYASSEKGAGSEFNVIIPSAASGESEQTTFSPPL